MVDELFELVLGEKGFVVEVRCDDSFNDAKYNRIKEILIALITEWKQNEYIPKKFSNGVSPIWIDDNLSKTMINHYENYNY